jgi:hypothetical protein
MFDKFKKWITSDASVSHYVIFSIIVFVAVAMSGMYELAGIATILALAYVRFRYKLLKK